MPIDYRELLMKYINHVGEQEGVTFIRGRKKPEYITGTEWETLEELDGESEKYQKN